MLKTKKYIIFISLILVFSMLFGLMAVLAKDAGVKSHSLDFSNALQVHKEEILPSEFLKLLKDGIELSDAEISYLDKYSDAFITVNGSFSNSVISTFAKDGILNVTAKEYSHISPSGLKVAYIPFSASYNGEKYSLSQDLSNNYIAKIPYSSEKENTFVTVDYSCKLETDKSFANYLLNFVYTEAQNAIRLEEEYEAVLGEYLESYRKYDAYLKKLEKYELDLEKYENYLEAKKVYEEDYAVYLDYLAELEDYAKKTAAYEKYLADYGKYLKDKAEYEKVYNEHIDSIEEYKKYYGQLNKINSSMYAMESIYTQPSSGLNPLFNALQNKEMVSLFEKYKDELTTIYGVDAKLIDDLSKDSDVLNGMLIAYGEARLVSNEAAFEYYSENYKEITRLFTLLYDSMDSIMTKKKKGDSSDSSGKAPSTLFNHICLKIGIEYKDPEQAEYKRWRILNVLSQIYLVSCCLDDTVSADGSWNFYSYDGQPHTYYFTELLSQNVILSDTDKANPKGLTWPTNVPDFVLPPLPTEPKKVSKPLAPAPVEKPLPPKEVLLPTEPEKVENPGEAPKGLDGLLKSAEIAQAFREGKIKEREKFTKNPEIVLYHSVKKLVSFKNFPILTVYGFSEQSEILQKEIKSPADFTLPQRAPVKEPDRKLIYTFEGFSTSPYELIPPVTDGTEEIKEDICIYSVFSSEKRKYTVNFVTPGGTQSQEYFYGETPVFSGSTFKEPTQTVSYTFKNWDPLPDKVTRDITYTATYSENIRMYSITWKTPDKVFEQKYYFDSIPSSPSFKRSFISGNSLFDFKNWDSPVENVRGDKIYTAVFEETKLVEGGNLTVSGSTYKINSDSGEVRIYSLLSLASREKKQIELSLGGVRIFMDKDTVASLSHIEADKIKVLGSEKGGQDFDFELKIYTKDGEIANSKDSVRITLPKDIVITDNFFAYAILGDGAKMEISYTFENGKISFESLPNSKIAFKKLFSVTFGKSENGGTMLDRYIFEEGSVLNPIFYPSVGYEPESFTVTVLESGEKIKLDTLDGFTMPKSDILISVKFGKIKYTVTFIANGETVSAEKYQMGDIPKIPEIEPSYEKDGYIYNFSGWSPTVSSVTGDVTYTAKYTSTLASMTDSSTTGNIIGGFLNNTVLPVAAITVSAVALIMLAVVLIKKRKK